MDFLQQEPETHGSVMPFLMPVSFLKCGRSDGGAAVGTCMCEASSMRFSVISGHHEVNATTKCSITRAQLFRDCASVRRDLCYNTIATIQTFSIPKPSETTIMSHIPSSTGANQPGGGKDQFQQASGNEPASNNKHQPGKLVGNDQVPEFNAEVSLRPPAMQL